MVTDPVSDLLIRIKNASAVRHEVVTMPYSKMLFSVGEALKRHGYIAGITKKGKKTTAKDIEITLLYSEKREPKVQGVERLSKPSRRLYCGVRDIKPVRNGYGLLMLSTPKGILSGSEARKEAVGGEMLFKIW